jgi:hypothetical protein
MLASAACMRAERTKIKFSTYGNQANLKSGFNSILWKGNDLLEFFIPITLVNILLISDNSTEKL